jgi:HPt (histidine-containing phosphotransfer) domain-containing protein
MAGSPSIDQTYLTDILELTEGRGVELLNRLVGLYLENSQKRLAKIRIAITEQDAKTLSFEAHTLKSGSANLGALELTRIAQELENIGKTGLVSDGAVLLLARFEKELVQVTHELHQFLEIKKAA